MESRPQKEMSKPLFEAAKNRNSYDWDVVFDIASNHRYREKAGFIHVLLTAANGGMDSVVACLLLAGTPPDAAVWSNHPDDYWRAREKWTSLHFAVDNGNMNLIRTLLYFGADRAIKNKAGKTAEEMAIDKNALDCAREIRSFDNRFTGKAIFERFTSQANFSALDAEEYTINKEGTYAHILQIKDKELRILALRTAKDPDTPLGQLFWFQRGVSKPSLEKGMLHRIVKQLEEEEKVPAPVVVSSTAKITETIKMPIAPPILTEQVYSHLMTPPMAASAPVYFTAAPVYPDWNQQAVPVSYSYPPMMQAVPAPLNNLVPVYLATNPLSFTNQMNGLPKVSELPGLPEKRERVEKRAYQYGS